MESVILGIVLIFSLLVHEYGHALTAAYFGARPGIILEGFGGRAEYNNFGMTPKQEFWVTLNGPLLESVLIALSYTLLKWDIFEGHPYIRYFLYVTMRLNILWCLLNLIPVAPLDGGHLVRHLLERKFGERGYRASILLGLVCAVVAVPYLCLQGYVFFGILLLIFGFQHFKLWRELAPRQEAPFSTYMKGVEAIEQNNLESAKTLLKKLLKAKDAHIKNLAVESLAKAYMQGNESQKSYDLLMKADHQSLKEGKSLLSKLAFERKNYDLAGKYSTEVYEMHPSYEIALQNSKTFAGLQEPALSGAWLETASRYRKDGIEENLNDPIYDSVREQEAFKQYLHKI